MQQIDLDKYQNLYDPICSLQSGEIVVAQEVDEDNNLIYIIRNGTQLRMSFAVAEQAIPVFANGGSSHVVSSSASGTV